ncbi:Hpt domain-containing protein [Aliiroseovarius crassostreae]|uniref:Hpt domain-containing protein n=1 Tax=Aliiroseovarius crassostreae TaxID=154981 RepID=UPI00220C6FB5|nr:Hpt domain-containing protein [Aliiroseovarius crassostreae]UWQ07776.1 Hpt domain-containing protein [Aliiroseovarius crassostreae]UWQ10881.1 Hpt domain-containing protein [Aliiroseovarius crassostreae]
MISWDRVAELKAEIGEEDFAEVAEMFLMEVDEVIDRLRNNPDPSQYEQDLHFLKSSAVNLGFDALSKLCGDGEQMAARGMAADVDLTAVFDTYFASKEVFTAH